MKDFDGMPRRNANDAARSENKDRVPGERSHSDWCGAEIDDGRHAPLPTNAIEANELSIIEAHVGESGQTPYRVSCLDECVEVNPCDVLSRSDIWVPPDVAAEFAKVFRDQSTAGHVCRVAKPRRGYGADNQRSAVARQADAPLLRRKIGAHRRLGFWERRLSGCPPRWDVRGGVGPGACQSEDRW